MESIKQFNVKFVSDNRVAICLFKMGHPILDLRQHNEIPVKTTFVFKNTDELIKDYETIMDNRKTYFEKYLI